MSNEVLDEIGKLDSKVRYADGILFSIHTLLAEICRHYINYKSFENGELKQQSAKLCKFCLETVRGKLEELKSVIQEIEDDYNNLEKLLLEEVGD